MFFAKPDVQAHLEYVWRAFDELGTERQIGMGIGPIPILKAREYAFSVLELNEDEEDRFITLIRAMDSEYVQASAPKKKGKDSEPEMQVAANDAIGVRSLMQSLAISAKARFGKKE